MIGLTDHRNNRLGTFSKGMRQRVAFGRCLLSVPRLLILDEPFDGIDNESRRNLLELLPKVVHELGAAALVASHNLGDIERVCDRIALINHGRVIASGTPCDLRENFGVMRKIKVTIRRRAGWDDAFIAGLAPDAVFNTETQQLEYDIDEALSSSEVIVKRLVDAGVPVTAVENSEPALEEMYFSLIEEDNAKCRG
jgi:ABC-2 type transport system ATP-binding protein